MIELLWADPASAAFVAGLFGLLVGSFLNVVILRLPARLEWQMKQEAREILELAPAYEPAPPGLAIERSHCPKCGHKLSWYENIPLFSFAVLRGKCRNCHARISWQYPLVEALTALLFAACAWQFRGYIECLLALYFTATLIVLAGIDMRTTYLPDELNQPLLWVGLLASLLAMFAQPVQVLIGPSALSNPAAFWPAPVSALFGAVVGYLSLWCVARLFKLIRGVDGMGAGDFKLLAALGAWCGVGSLLGIVLLSSLVGAIVGGAWLLLRGKDSSTQIPFGPYLAIAGWLQFFFHFDLLALVARGAAPV
jgi:leader peptidase (prepilin peptidase)/N-methyltransferase